MQVLHSSKHTRFYASNKQDHHKTDCLNHLLDPFASSEAEFAALIAPGTEFVCIQVSLSTVVIRNIRDILASQPGNSNTY